MSNWLVQILCYVCCNWLHETIETIFFDVCCTSCILWAFLCRRYAYFCPTKCDMVNDHVVHQLLWTEVLRMWLQNSFWCNDCMYPEVHAQLFLKVYQKSLLKNCSCTCSMWCPGTKNFVDLVCRDVILPLGSVSFLTLKSNHFYLLLHKHHAK